jgi:hypothetical protein
MSYEILLSYEVSGELSKALRSHRPIAAVTHTKRMSDVSFTPSAVERWKGPVVSSVLQYVKVRVIEPLAVHVELVHLDWLIEKVELVEVAVDKVVDVQIRAYEVVVLPHVEP